MRADDLRRARKLATVIYYTGRADDIEPFVRDLAELYLSCRRADILQSRLDRVFSGTNIAMRTQASVPPVAIPMSVSQPSITELCGCGRPKRHYGRCKARRLSAQPRADDPTPGPPKKSADRLDDGRIAPVSAPSPQPPTTTATVPSVSRETSKDNRPRLNFKHKRRKPLADQLPDRNSEQNAIERFLAEHGVTQCPKPSEAGELTFNHQTRLYRRETP